MKTIEIKYRHIPSIPVTTTLTGSFPESWSDLTPAQLMAIAHIQNQPENDLEFLHQLTGIKLTVLQKLSAFQLWELAQGFEWVMEIKPLDYFIIPHVSYRNTFFISPLRKLKGFSFGQFIFADTCFCDYQHSKSHSDLNRFVSSLYLPGGITFSDALIETNAPLMTRVPPACKEGIALNYFLVKQWLADIYPLVFQPAAHSDKPGKTAKGADNGWIRIFEQIVGDDIINADRYASLPIHNVLRFLTQRIKENLKKH